MSTSKCAIQTKNVLKILITVKCCHHPKRRSAQSVLSDRWRLIRAYLSKHTTSIAKASKTFADITNEMCASVIEIAVRNSMQFHFKLKFVSFLCLMDLVARWNTSSSSDFFPLSVVSSLSDLFSAFTETSDWMYRTCKSGCLDENWRVSLSRRWSSMIELTRSDWRIT